MTDRPAIEVVGLCKSYGDLRAVDHVDLEVAEGEFVGILGPNGAGKTTALEMVEGLREPDAGTIHVLGEPVWPRNASLLPRIGVQLQASSFFERLTAREQIRTFASLYGTPRQVADDWLEKVGLVDKADTRVEDLSGGQSQRLSIACALVHDPEVLFLDEPTAALDPQARRNLWDLLSGLNDSGRTVVLTTHYMDEAEALCDRVAIIDAGRILEYDTPAALVRGLDAPARVTVAPGQLSVEEARAMTGVDDAAESPDGLVLTTRTPAPVLGALAETDRLDGVRVQTATLEDVFLARHRPRVPGMSAPVATPGPGAFRAIAVAIIRGFVRDRAAVFFSIVFPLMFLVLFGGLFSDQGQSKVELIQVGDVPLFDELPDGADEAFDDAFDVTRSDDLAAAIEEVRKGDSDVAVEMRDGVLVAHYTQTDQVKAAVTQGTLQAFVDGANVAASGQPPRFSLEAERVEDDSLTTIQFVTPGLLGWAVAMSAAFGAAATIQGWRQSKLMRRLQLSPVSTRTIVGARVAVAVGIALTQGAIFLGVGAAAFGLTLTGAWWMSIPLLVVGTLCFMAVGLLAGAITTTTEGAVNAANFMVLPMAFLSGSFFPLDDAPPWLRTFSNLLPLKHLNEGMLDVMVRGQGPGAALLPIGILAGFAVVVTLVAARLFRWETA